MTASPIAQEAARLVEALGDWFAGAAGSSAGAGAPGAGTHRFGEAFTTGAPECALCPWCRLVGVLRGLNPDVAEHLAGAAQEVVAALRVAFDPPAAGAPGGGRRGSVQHIDIGD